MTTRSKIATCCRESWRVRALKWSSAQTGKEALERVKSCPDLVILDVKLPDLSGYEVCRRIKADPVTRSIPVLQISASFVSNESKVQALEGGADGYLTHPIDATVLVATVKSLLRLKQAELISRQSAQQWQSTVDACRNTWCCWIQKTKSCAAIGRLWS